MLDTSFCQIFKILVVIFHYYVSKTPYPSKLSHIMSLYSLPPFLGFINLISQPNSFPLISCPYLVTQLYPFLDSELFLQQGVWPLSSPIFGISSPKVKEDRFLLEAYPSLKCPQLPQRGSLLLKSAQKGPMT